MIRFLSVLAALCVAATAFAHEIKVGDLEIIHPNIPLPAGNAHTAAGYMGISNTGATADRLLSISVGFAQDAGLHLSKVDDSGVATMEPVKALDIPAGDTVLLEPGGYHVMFLGLTSVLAEGDMLPATLTFEKAGKIEIEFMVDPPGGGTDHDMDGMDMTTGD
jgi:copper(I)-binding protein